MGKASAARRARQDKELSQVWLQSLVAGIGGVKYAGKTAAVRELRWSRDEQGMFTVTSPALDREELGPLTLTSTQVFGETKRQLYRRHAATLVDLLAKAGIAVFHRPTDEVQSFLARQRANAAAHDAAARKAARAGEVLRPFGPGAGAADAPAAPA